MRSSKPGGRDPLMSRRITLMGLGIVYIDQIYFLVLFSFIILNWILRSFYPRSLLNIIYRTLILEKKKGKKKGGDQHHSGGQLPEQDIHHPSYVKTLAEKY